MATLFPDAREKAREGDLSALLTVHEFCRERNVKDQSTFTSILDIILQNSGSKSQPHFKNRSNTPPNNLVGLCICATILADSMDSLLFSPRNGRAPEEDLKAALPLSALCCRRIAQHWSTHIWPCISSIMDWYILDDMRAAISDNIHQVSLNLVLARLLLHLQKPQFGILSRMKDTPGVASCAIRVYLQALDWGQHPTLSLASEVMQLTYQDGPTVISEIEKHLTFVPAVVAHLRNQGASVDAHFKETLTVISTVTSFFDNSTQPAKQIAKQCPALLDEMMRIWRLHVRALPMIGPRRLPTAEEGSRLEMIRMLLCLACIIVIRGGRYAGRQAVKRRLIRHILEIFPLAQMVEWLLTPSEDLLSQSITGEFHRLLRVLGSYLSYYSVISPVLHELAFVDANGLRDVLISVNGAHRTHPKLMEAWAKFRQFAESRVPIVNEYKELNWDKNPCCASKCPGNADSLTSRRRRCSGCECVFYCSRECQKQDWMIHKKQCSQHRDTTLLDTCDGDFLIFQASFDIEHYRREEDERLGGDNDDITCLICDYRQLPPRLELQCHDPNHVPAGLPPVPDPSMAVVAMMLNDVIQTKLALYGFASKDVISKALASEKVERKRGERLVQFGGVMQVYQPQK